MAGTSDPPLLVKVQDGVAHLTLNRPDKRNAVNDALIEALDAFFANPLAEAKVAILEGAGAHFCAGLDLAEHKTRTAIDWTSLARLDGTIVCYAGPDQLPHMLHALMTHGRPDTDSAALIYDGTLATQQTTLGTLADIAASV